LGSVVGFQEASEGSYRSIGYDPIKGFAPIFSFQRIVLNPVNAITIFAATFSVEGFSATEHRNTRTVLGVTGA